MFDSCICVEPNNICELIGRTQPIARKQHRCGECRCTIKPGQKYERDVTVFEGELTTYKTCITCVHVRDSLFRCGWCYGGVWETVHETFCGHDDDDEMECVCPTAAEAAGEE